MNRGWKSLPFYCPRIWVEALATLLLAVTCAGCASADLKERLQRDEAAIARLNTVLAQTQGTTADLQDGLTMALCRPEIKQLLDDVQRECSAPPSANHSEAPGSCDTKMIHPAVVSADPEHRGRFLKLMTFLRHEAVYLRKGGAGMVSYRQMRLERLARQTVLRRTRILVVAHPVPGEAQADVEAGHRAEVVIKLLRHYGIERPRIMTWIYDFPVIKTDIESPIDRPAPGEPADLKRAVWVFRADC